MDPLFIDPLILLAIGGSLAARKARTMTKDEKAFLRAMIPHHEEAVRMANEAIAKGASGRVLALARRVVRTQTKEIAEMRTWLASSRSS